MRPLARSVWAVLLVLHASVPSAAPSAYAEEHTGLRPTTMSMGLGVDPRPACSVALQVSGPNQSVPLELSCISCPHVLEASVFEQPCGMQHGLYGHFCSE